MSVLAVVSEETRTGPASRGYFRAMMVVVQHYFQEQCGTLIAANLTVQLEPGCC